MKNIKKYRHSSLIHWFQGAMSKGFTCSLLVSVSLCTVITSSAQVPTSWSNLQPYKSGSLVLNQKGNTFIAQQDVSSGIALSNTSYWASLDEAAPTSVPGGAPFTTPDTSTVPLNTPLDQGVGSAQKQADHGSVTKMHLGDTEVVVASSTQDTSLSHACCGGEDLHKEEQDRAGPRPGNPGGSGYVDYKLEWEKVTVRLGVLEDEIKKELDKQAEQDVKIITLGEEIANRMAEISKTEEDLAKCQTMGAKLLAGLSSKQKVLGGLDNNIAQLVAKRQNLENEILECNQELAELSSEYTKLEEEYAPLAAKLGVPHVKGWHYEAEQGWLYVEVGSYPYVFSERLDAWMYYKQGSHSPWEYFNYNTQSWVAWR